MATVTRAPERTDEQRWTLVVPLKAAPAGKSRLAGWIEPGDRLALARAMMADTVAAAAAARGVDEIVVVTDDPAMAGAARRAAGESSPQVSVTVIGEPDPGGLNPAISAGIERAREDRPGHGVAVLLGDLPALRAADLAGALERAARHRLGAVADAAGTGTTVLTALPGVPVDPAFGADSARLHLARGHVFLAVATPSGLTRDVDVPADLDAVLALGVGPHTARALRAIDAMPRRVRGSERYGPA